MIPVQGRTFAEELRTAAGLLRDPATVATFPPLLAGLGSACAAWLDREANASETTGIVSHEALSAARAVTVHTAKARMATT